MRVMEEELDGAQVFDESWGCFVPPTDEISPGELGRKLDDLKSDIRDDMAEIKSKFSDVVYRDTFESELRAVRDRQTGLEKSLAFTRGLMVTIFVAIIGLVGTIMAILEGSGS